MDSMLAHTLNWALHFFLTGMIPTISDHSSIVVPGMFRFSLISSFTFSFYLMCALVVC